MESALMRVYMIFDRLAEEAGPVFEQKNDAVALRAYRKMLSNQGASPDEYQLLWIGTIDHVTLKCVINDVPVEVIAGAEVPNA